MPGKHPPSGQRIRRRVERHHYVYRDVVSGKKKSQKAWKLSRRAGERQQHIRRAIKALKEAAKKPISPGARKPLRSMGDFEPVVVEINAITYEEG